ncbi:MAG: NAD(P)/FAD-dependent oxidoreductase [Deinococcales bacterium]
MLSYDVTIVGAGVIGCALARELSRYRLRVLLVEQAVEVGFGTSKANSGIIHAGHHSDPDTLKGALEWEGNRHWPGLADELGFGFRRIGELTVAFDEEDRRTLRRLMEQGQRKGVPGLELWPAERVRAEEPNLSTSVVEALHAPTAAVVNPYEACFNLAENAVLNGVELAAGEAVRAIEADAEGLLVHTPSRTVHTRFVLNAAGLFADRIAALAGAEPFTIRARKGEEYVLDKRLEGMVSRLIFPCPTPHSKGILVIPTYDGTLMVGPTARLTDKDDLSTTPEGAEEVFAGAQRLVPGISERDCIAEFAGLRAVLESEDFLIGPTRVRGLLNVAGIQSPGLTAAPVIAERVVELLGEEGLPLELDDGFIARLEPTVRVAGLDPEVLAALARVDPRYARIVCRCELVTEGEVLDAILRGARTLDGLKFRTRAGMGRCQGGFCTWRCLALLSQATDTPIPSLTKRGDGSWVVCEREDRAGEAPGG